MNFINTLNSVDKYIYDNTLSVNIKDKKIFEFYKNIYSEMNSNELEILIQNAKKLSLQYFGNVISLYSPIYISNYCENRCVYCSFNIVNSVKRDKLTLDEIREEGLFLKSKGIDSVLILTGESRKFSDFEYIKNSVLVLKKIFSQVSIEIYPLEEEEYRELATLGVYGVTLYQETYNREKYEKFHLKGRKSDFEYRIMSIERAAKSGMRSINLGVLLGLNDFREDIFKLGLHLNYLMKKYPNVEYSVSLPRIKEIETIEKKERIYSEVTDRDFVKIIGSIRNFIPYIAINISTREKLDFRKNLVKIGINKMSAEVSTSVGGHIVRKNSDEQFSISDKSSAKEIENMLNDMNYQTVYKDWVIF